MARITKTVPFLALALVTALPALAGGPPPSFQYTGAGVVVTSVGVTGQQTILDNGAVACDTTTNSGVGGACIPFAMFTGDSVQVVDDYEGFNVAFQVCVDVNGDNFCGLQASPSPPGPCTKDIVVFSHANNGDFYNPLSVPSDAISQFYGCASAGFPGLVVITCAGAHGDSSGLAHPHDVTHGIVTAPFTGGTPTGDFCGAQTATKAYVAV